MFHLIFPEKVTFVRTNWLTWVIQLMDQFGCLLSLMSGMLISLGIKVVYPTTDFHSLLLGYFVVVSFLFLLYVFSSRVLA